MPWYDGNIPALWEAALERKTGAKIAIEVVLDPDGQNVTLNDTHDVTGISEITQERELDVEYGGRATIQDVTLTFNDPDAYFSESTLASPFHQAVGTLDRDHAVGATTLKLLSHEGVAFAADEELEISDGTHSEEVVVASFTPDDGSTGYHALVIDAPGLVNAFAAGVRIWSRPVVGREMLVSLTNQTETTTEKLPVFQGRIVRAPELSVGQARITIADSRKLLLDTRIVGADSSADLKLMTIGTSGELKSSIDWGGAFNKPPLAYTIESGSLPAGLLLDSATGVISGTPTTVETQTPVIRVTNADGEYVSQQISIETVDKVNTEFDSAEGDADYELHGVAGGLVDSAASLSAREGYLRLSVTNKDNDRFCWDVTAPDYMLDIYALKSSALLTGDWCIISRIESAGMPSIATMYFGIGVVLGGTIFDGGGYVIGYNQNSTRIGVYDASANNNFGNVTPVATTMEFRVRKVGTTYHFSYRAVGGTWTDFATKSSSQATSRIGLIVASDDATSTNVNGYVDYDFLRAYYGELTVATAALPATIAGDSYSHILRATGGAGEYIWDISLGSLPAGLTLNTSTGEISGTPTSSGLVSFTVRVTDGAAVTATSALSIDVSSDYQVLPTVLPWGYTDAAYSEALRVYVGGALDRTQVTVGARCPLGQWKFKFTSAAAFEVTSPGLGVFTGDIATEFDIAGVLTIPAAAWSSGMAKDDEMTFITGKSWAAENPVQILYDILTITAGLSAKQLHASSFFGDILLGTVTSHNTTTEAIKIAVNLPALLKAGESLNFGSDAETVATGNDTTSSYPPEIPIIIAATAKNHAGKAVTWKQRTLPDADWTFDAEYLYCQAACILISLCLDRDMTIAQAIEAVAVHAQLFTFHDFGLEHLHAIRPRGLATVTELTDAELKKELATETSAMINQITVEYAYDYIGQLYQSTYTYPESDAENPSYLRYGVIVAKTIYAPGLYTDEAAQLLAMRVYELYQAGLEVVRLNLDLRGLTFRMGEQIDIDSTDPDIEARFELVSKKVSTSGGKNIELSGYNIRELSKFALAESALADVACAW